MPANDVGPSLYDSPQCTIRPIQLYDAVPSAPLRMERPDAVQTIARGKQREDARREKSQKSLREVPVPNLDFVDLSYATAFAACCAVADKTGFSYVHKGSTSRNPILIDSESPPALHAKCCEAISTRVEASSARRNKGIAVGNKCSSSRRATSTKEVLAQHHPQLPVNKRRRVEIDLSSALSTPSISSTPVASTSIQPAHCGSGSEDELTNHAEVSVEEAAMNRKFRANEAGFTLVDTRLAYRIEAQSCDVQEFAALHQLLALEEGRGTALRVSLSASKKLSKGQDDQDPVALEGDEAAAGHAHSPLANSTLHAYLADITGCVPYSTASAAQPPFLATLPLLNSSLHNPTPRGLTNGTWVLAALRLHAQGRVRLEASLARFEPQDRYADESGSDQAEENECLDFCLHIKVDVLQAAFSKASDCRVARDTLDVLRFAAGLPQRCTTEQARNERETFSALQETVAVEVDNDATEDADEDAEILRKTPPDASLVYESMPSPSRALDYGATILQHPDLVPTLLPFQRRSVGFLLGREGKRFEVAGKDGQFELVEAKGIMTARGTVPLGFWYEEVFLYALPGERLFFDSMYGCFTHDEEAAAKRDVKGGILAEEMGLGKTVEIIALILHNPAPASHTSAPAYYNAPLELHVTPVKATLIIAPETLREQWIEEMARHAPSLTVYSFPGHVQAAKDVVAFARKCQEAPSPAPAGGSDSAKENGIGWVDFAQRFDVIIVSFPVLSHELHTARTAPERSRRKERKYERPRSPLIQLEFHRVCVDEVQLFSKGAMLNQAFQTVSMIPRQSSIAVSGTPVKMIRDLQSMSQFLRIPGFELAHATEHLVSARMKPQLIRMLRLLSTRQTKDNVSEELAIPKQIRQLVPVNFTSIESAFYKDQWNLGLAELGLRDDGSKVRETMELDPPLMRDILSRLRRACTHPHIAMRSVRNTLAYGATFNLRSIDDVLDLMLERTRADWYRTRLGLVSKSIDRVSLMLQNKDDGDRHLKAQDTLETLKEECTATVAEIEATLDQARLRGPLYRFTEDEVAQATSRRGEEAESEETEALRARNLHMRDVQGRLRGWLEQLHRTYQFLGNTCFQIGELLNASGGSSAPGGQKEKLKERENEAYDAAESVRQELLRATREHAQHARSNINRRRADWTLQDWQVEHNFDVGGGIAVAPHFSRLQALQQLLDENAKVLLLWRDRILERITKDINREIDQQNEADDQYKDNLDAQHEAEALLEMYRVLMAERELILTGKHVVNSTSKPQLFATLETVVREARRNELLGLGRTQEEEEALDAQRVQLEHFKALDDVRNQVKLRGGTPSVADTIVSLRDSADRISNPEETLLLREATLDAREMLSRQTKLLDSAKRDANLMSALYNGRSAYFEQLQSLSDMVTDVPTNNPLHDISKCKAEEEAAHLKIGTLSRRLRYLQHLNSSREVEDQDSEVQECFMCTDVIRRGVLTDKCGHVACESCFNEWLKSKRTCPMCNTKLVGPADFHRIVYRQLSPGVEQRSSVQTLNLQHFNCLQGDPRKDIEVQSATGRFGSKMDLLVKHIQYIQRTTGEKSVVFSSFTRGLDLVEQALRANAIRSVRLQGSGSVAGAAAQRFRTEPELGVFLLHSEGQSSGLNLLCASNVFLLEPLVNHALELQAIGRIHRIGQPRKTHVFTYFVLDTVEENIIALSQRKGHSLYEMCQHRQQEDPALFTVQASQNQPPTHRAARGDFVSSVDDLFVCFFAS
ncbi:hypothetical protein K437DRAFT_259885 [Tilletiaria anomala UBC 951]|uniref:RING-type domain-containing protein n=1 Tax=Tilletiaria anomala (strain ATCC 24038 / CBS 436.72 / UBC 951) TaxID=1037660 RepID=A0A066VF59_TILAU|nr:uncharacterized protein K437DRAFT_259885 [Tilletiaria anomala UBC 951]KDN37235.1 hypothetical protein K437DRAFT_259885 [Tilletiaria anomala UBC 951]